MAKHRKTRKEKELADSRHNFTHKFVSAAPFEVKFEAPKKSKSSGVSNAQTQVVSVSAYSYLVKDLSKTAALTLAILAFQVILFFFLKHHLLVIPGLSY
jgi:hypothetical protein